MRFLAPSNIIAAFALLFSALALGTRVLVTNLDNGRSVIVRINDRGPFVSGRVIDVTPAAARALGFSGLVRVTPSVLDALN